MVACPAPWPGHVSGRLVPTKSVVLFSGPVKLDRGKARVEFDVPEFNGELRVMAVAWSPSGVGSGSSPVTVRDPVPAEMILPRAVEVTSRIPNAHGAPLWIGAPAGIGITDIDKPDFGKRVTIKRDEVPAFWSCGVTATLAIQHANLDFVLTQEPNHVFISDIREEDVAFLNLPPVA